MEGVRSSSSTRKTGVDLTKQLAEQEKPLTGFPCGSLSKKNVDLDNFLEISLSPGPC